MEEVLKQLEALRKECLALAERVTTVIGVVNKLCEDKKEVNECESFKTKPGVELFVKCQGCPDFYLETNPNGSLYEDTKAYCKRYNEYRWLSHYDLERGREQ